jgi:hypothetical protein
VIIVIRIGWCVERHGRGGMRQQRAKSGEARHAVCPARVLRRAVCRLRVSRAAPVAPRQRSDVPDDSDA